MASRGTNGCRSPGCPYICDMIVSLTMPATTGINPILFPEPKAGSEGTVTILCGPNGSGKSFILKTLINLLNEKDAAMPPLSQGWSLKKSASVTSHYRPRHHVTAMRSAGVLTRARAGYVVKPSQPEKYSQLAIFGALLAALPQCRGFDPAKWETDPAYRQSQIDKVGPHDEELGYWFGTQAPPFVSAFNKAVQGRLGVRHNKDGLELLLSQGEGASAPFPNWSDGQKSLFTIFAITELLKPEVFVFDEIENFLHPALVSGLLSHLKKNCRQTVLSSHHPHLVFGRIIDAVYYVERAVRVGDPPQRILKYQAQPAVPRHVSLLSDDRSKLASIYKLFDVQDAALLATGAFVRDAADLQLHTAVHGHFECGAVGANASPYMDRQSEQIMELIRSFSPSPNLVIDWGAGVGRSLTELEKRVPVVSSEHYSWLLYDVSSANAGALAKLVPAQGTTIRVANSRSDLADVAAGIFLLTNVLHALDPTTWCEAIEDAWGAVHHDGNGIVLITEIFPLLAAESQAIAIPLDWATRLFRQLGFKTTAHEFPVHGAKSYCLALSQPPAALPARDELLMIVVHHWKQLNEQFLGDYEGVGSRLGMADHQRLLNAAFGMARIASCLRTHGR